MANAQRQRTDNADCNRFTSAGAAARLPPVSPLHIILFNRHFACTHWLPFSFQQQNDINDHHHHHSRFLLWQIQLFSFYVLFVRRLLL